TQVVSVGPPRTARGGPMTRPTDAERIYRPSGGYVVPLRDSARARELNAIRWQRDKRLKEEGVLTGPVSRAEWREMYTTRAFPYRWERVYEDRLADLLHQYAPQDGELRFQYQHLCRNAAAASVIVDLLMIRGVGTLPDGLLAQWQGIALKN